MADLLLILYNLHVSTRLANILQGALNRERYMLSSGDQSFLIQLMQGDIERLRSDKVHCTRPLTQNIDRHQFHMLSHLNR